MKKDICLLLLTVVFLLTGCNQVQTTEGYVNSKLNEYSKSAVRFIRLTESENELNLKSCHPVSISERSRRRILMATVVNVSE